MKILAAVAAAASLFSVSAHSADRNVYPARGDHYTIILPEGWQTDTNLSVGASYTYFDLAGPAGTEADGVGAHVLFRGKLEGGLFTTLQADYFWMTDVPTNHIDFGYGRAGLGYHHEFTPHIDLGVEAGALLQIGEDFFANDDGKVAGYGRAMFRTKLVGDSDLSITASYSESIKTGEIRYDIPMWSNKVLFGLVGTMGKAEFSDFWSLGPSFRFVFDR